MILRAVAAVAGVLLVLAVGWMVSATLTAWDRLDALTRDQDQGHLR